MSDASGKNKEGWIIGLSVVGGLLICLALLWVFFSKTAVKSPDRRRAVAQEMREFREAAKSEEGAGSTERITKTRDELVKSAADLQGMERQVAEAIAAMLDELAPKLEAYEKTSQALSEAGYATPPFSGLEEVAAREALIENFKSANSDLSVSFDDVGGKLKLRFDQEKIPNSIAENELRSFLSNLNVAEKRKLRELDAVMAGLMLKQLALYRKQWGQWTLQEDGSVMFQDPSAMEEFDALQSTFQSARAEQAKLLAPDP